MTNAQRKRAAKKLNHKAARLARNLVEVFPRDDLRDFAKAQNIAGRGKMNKHELAFAVAKDTISHDEGVNR